MSPGGRRPGPATARDDIIRAARHAFAADGYDRTSLRAIARTAGVDAALVHHYFDGKPDLFIAAMHLPLDPRAVQRAADAHMAGTFEGAAVVEAFLSMWDAAQGTGSSFVACAAAMAASEAVADAMREFVSERVWQHLQTREGEDVHVTNARRALVASQLLGLAFTRYVLRVPPISTASAHDVARWAGPTLERYVSGTLA